MLLVVSEPAAWGPTKKPSTLAERAAYVGAGRQRGPKILRKYARVARFNPDGLGAAVFHSLLAFKVFLFLTAIAS